MTQRPAVASDRHADLAGALATALEGHRLLDHPFYRRWEAGELSPGELAEYAVHYRAFEAVLPEVLSTVVDRLTDQGHADAAELVARNLSDELGRPEAHLALFDGFAAALPVAPTADGPGPAAHTLADTYRALAQESPVAAVAGLAAYESQAAAIATSKGDGLRRWYRLTPRGPGSGTCTPPWTPTTASGPPRPWRCSTRTPTRWPRPPGGRPTHGGPCWTSGSSRG